MKLPRYEILTPCVKEVMQGHACVVVSTCLHGEQHNRIGGNDVDFIIEGTFVLVPHHSDIPNHSKVMEGQGPVGLHL